MLVSATRSTSNARKYTVDLAGKVDRSGSCWTLRYIATGCPRTASLGILSRTSKAVVGVFLLLIDDNFSLNVNLRDSQPGKRCKLLQNTRSLCIWSWGSGVNVFLMVLDEVGLSSPKYLSRKAVFYWISVAPSRRTTQKPLSDLRCRPQWTQGNSGPLDYS